jgi:hypothetical protein
MPKIIGRATSWSFLYLMDCVGTFINFSESARVRSLYLKLSQAVRAIQDSMDRLRVTNVSPEQEGLGATYDKRKWNESYYGKPRSRNNLFLR